MICRNNLQSSVKYTAVIITIDILAIILLKSQFFSILSGLVKVLLICFSDEINSVEAYRKNKMFIFFYINICSGYTVNITISLSYPPQTVQNSVHTSTHSMMVYMWLRSIYTISTFHTFKMREYVSAVPEWFSSPVLRCVCVCMCVSICLFIQYMHLSLHSSVYTAYRCEACERKAVTRGRKENRERK